MTNSCVDRTEHLFLSCLHVCVVWWRNKPGEAEEKARMNVKEIGGWMNSGNGRKGRMEEGKEKSCNGGGRTEETKER